MPLGLVTAIIDAISKGPEGGEYASFTIAGVDPADPSKIYKNDGADFSERALQYWPESLSDTIDTGWDFKNVAGGSSALAQWTSTNGRTLSFDIQLSRTMAPIKRRDPRYELTLKEKTTGTMLLDPNDDFGVDQKPHNVNIVEYIKFLRGFCYPTYIDVENIISASPPPIALIHAPNMGLSEDGSDAIYAVMTGCDVTYNLCFIDGTPRRATVAVTVRQVVQSKDGIKFYGFGKNAPARYDMEKSYNKERLNKSAGRSVNGGLKIL